MEKYSNPIYVKQIDERVYASWPVNMTSLEVNVVSY